MSAMLLAVLFVAPTRAEPPLLPKTPDPLAAELACFPSAEVATVWIDWGEMYLDGIEQRIAGGLLAAWKNEWTAYVLEMRGRVYCWSLLRRAHNRACDLDVRRELLKELRFRLGPLWYFHGYLPPPVETACVARMD